MFFLASYDEFIATGKSGAFNDTIIVVSGFETGAWCGFGVLECGVVCGVWCVVCGVCCVLCAVSCVVCRVSCVVCLELNSFTR